jgi:hypothetical protein
MAVDSSIMTDETVYEYAIVEVFASNPKDVVKLTPYPSAKAIQEAMDQVLCPLTVVNGKLIYSLGF